MILAVGGIKGGSGKSTIATNLCVMRSLSGADVLLVDADDQETSTDFTSLRNERISSGAGYTSIKLTGAAVRTEVLRLEAKYTDIFIDTGGRDTTSQRAALAVADAVLIPFVPRSFDVWTLERVSSVVNEMRSANPDLRALAFLNRADPRGSDNFEAAAEIADTAGLDFLETSLGARKAFANAGATGLSVVELRPEDYKASREIRALYGYLFDI